MFRSGRDLGDKYLNYVMHFTFNAGFKFSFNYKIEMENCTEVTTRKYTSVLKCVFAVLLLSAGPSCSKLKTPLVNISLKFQMLISQICQYFVEKI